MENQVLQAAKNLEKQVDNEITNMDKMEQCDFESLRARRIEALREQQHQKQRWLERGHGEYSEISDEKEFFNATKASLNVICHFYRESTERCKIIDKHLKILAPKHVETRFVKIDAEKSKFLVERLRIVVLPTICLIREGKTIDYVVGFDDMGGIDEFPTEILEWRIARSHVINYEGDLSVPPVKGTKKNLLKGKAIRGIKDDDSSDDNDW